MAGTGIYDIVGYDYAGDRLCVVCVREALPTGEGEELEGFAAVEGETTEEFLQGIADEFGIDRMNSREYSASQFPKVLFRGHAGGQPCDKCKKELA